MKSIKFSETKDWLFDVDEVSAGVYRVKAVDAKGRRIEITGPDPDVLLLNAKNDVMKLIEYMN